MLKPANPYQLCIGGQVFNFVPHQTELLGGHVLITIGREQPAADARLLNLSVTDARLLASYLQCAANEAEQLARKQLTKQRSV